MFSRRYLRRSFVAALVLPVALLGLFVIYQNRTALFPENLSQEYHHHHHHHDHNENGVDVSHQIIRKYSKEPIFHIKRLTTNGYSTSKLYVNNAEQVKDSPKLQYVPRPNSFNNAQQLQIVNHVQPILPLQYQIPTLSVIDTKKLERFVHLDLKGAAPKVVYYETLFPYLKELGANGLLIEYEDMFPFTDNLSVLRHGFSYSKSDIEKILKLAEQNNLKVMPLLQVYGHLEYVLKLKEFMHLREDKRYPQVITPCLEESYKLLFEMIDQLLLQHPSIPYLHIGCDEVYYRLVHPQCTNLHFRDEADLFIR
ncbi:unnamed protein product [Rotaria socialis]|uniref:beta-N-acetylhexosaminidase n=1 Tax=Rotaria socialis TaxID=392032 RepID=A0A818C2E8_9BILA|nr:unnamed protein product [Rotaria socialis]CAF3325528.1 unnamed protein product [Rotaria socialis]CAF3336859.1 unnamed protein product [Rotaria socialis]CAF3423669.1 unnamed protein product [Rotaria socialis]CAF3667654.1 unnamed protein product [Rotaria socialis]